MHRQWSKRTLLTAAGVSAQADLGLVVWALGAACVALSGSCTAAQGATNAASAIIIPRSVFADDPAGKDPFFPNSTRVRNQPDGSGNLATNVVPSVNALVFKGITGPPEKRIALINNLTFAKGEEGDVRVPGGKITIRCVDIREKSVVVTVGGQSEEHEIKLMEKPPLKTD